MRASWIIDADDEPIVPLGHRTPSLAVSCTPRMSGARAPVRGDNARDRPRRRAAMDILVIIAALLVLAAVISLALSFVGAVLWGALRLLPFVFTVLAVAVLVRWYRDRR